MILKCKKILVKFLKFFTPFFDQLQSLQDTANIAKGIEDARKFRRCSGRFQKNLSDLQKNIDIFYVLYKILVALQNN